MCEIASCCYKQSLRTELTWPGVALPMHKMTIRGSEEPAGDVLHIFQGSTIRLIRFRMPVNAIGMAAKFGA